MCVVKDLIEGELRATVLRVRREGKAVFFLDVGGRISDCEARMWSWITVCCAKGEGWFEQGSIVLLLCK
jgi:hypothetical protein